MEAVGDLGDRGDGHPGVLDLVQEVRRRVVATHDRGDDVRVEDDHAKGSRPGCLGIGSRS
jgi:hypothetical protein